MNAKQRFTLFRAALKDALGYTALYYAAGRVTVIDMYSRQQVEDFATLRQAIDHYARHMPASLL